MIDFHKFKPNNPVLALKLIPRPEPLPIDEHIEKRLHGSILVVNRGHYIFESLQHKQDYINKKLIPHLQKIFDSKSPPSPSQFNIHIHTARPPKNIEDREYQISSADKCRTNNQIKENILYGYRKEVIYRHNLIEDLRRQSHSLLWVKEI